MSIFSINGNGGTSDSVMGNDEDVRIQARKLENISGNNQILTPFWGLSVRSVSELNSEGENF